jgi:hypothetical protein
MLGIIKGWNKVTKMEEEWKQSKGNVGDSLPSRETEKKKWKWSNSKMQKISSLIIFN